MPISIPSRIVGVTVYRRGARVTRAVSLPRPTDGFHRAVLVPDLPITLFDASVRVRVDSDTEDSILPKATQFRVVLAPTSDTEDLEDSLKNALKEARRAVADTKRRLDRLNGFKKRLNDDLLYPRPENKPGQPPISSPVEGRLTWLGFLRDRGKQLEQNIGSLTETLREQKRALEQLEAEKAATTTDRPARATELRKALHVFFDTEAADAEHATLFIDYDVPGARWMPSYNLIVPGSDNEVRLTLKAVIAQRTGEDWAGVNISLSTALPNRFTPLSELKALKVGRQQAGPPRAVPRPVPSVEPLYADYDHVLRQYQREKDETKKKRDARPTEDAAKGAELVSADLDMFIPDAAAPQGGAPSEPLPPAVPARRIIPAPAVVPAPMAAPSLRSRAVMPAALSGSVLSTGSPPQPSPVVKEASEVALDERLLAFNELRMPGPDEPHRGCVVPVSINERYLELIGHQQTAIAASITETIRTALRLAERVETAALPAGYRTVKSPLGFAYAYRGDHLVEVPSDGQFHTISLQTKTAVGRLDYVSVPRKTPKVFRRLTFTNPFDAPLLFGPVEVMSADGEYLPQGEIDTAPKGKEASIWLGVEQRIKIARNIAFKETSSGLLRGHLSLEHTVSIDVMSHLDHEADTEIRERLPVIREDEEEIKVTLKTVTPNWQSFDQEEKRLKGGYAWHVTLAPKEEKHLEACYVVEIPSKYQLDGGNRREA